MFGSSGKIDVIVPYAWESGSTTFAGESAGRSVRGPGDPRVRVSVNFYGAPALRLEDYASYEQDLIVGASLQVLAPLGQYEQDKLLNVGNKRRSSRWDPLIRGGLWGALDVTDYRGGKSTVDGVTSDDLQSNTRVGATLALPLNRYHSLKLYGSNGASVRFGGGYDTIGAAWQVRWGGGL
ncbi:MAG: hypothetical protein WEF50_19975 [Myxococcota bacterium]